MISSRKIKNISRLYPGVGKTSATLYDAPMIWAKSDPAADITANDMAVANWSVTHGTVAGSGTETLPSIPFFYFPIKTQEETIGVIGIQLGFKNLLPEQRRILGTIANLTSLAATRWVKT